jgi:hypothetical protein
MVRAHWTEDAPETLNDVGDAEELGAKWEGDELITYDLDGFKELYEYYETNDYLSDTTDPGQHTQTLRRDDELYVEMARAGRAEEA